MKVYTFFFFLFCLSANITAQESVRSTMPNLEQYLRDNNIITKKTSYGLYYSVDEASNSKKPQKGDYVMVHFKGKTLDGKVFDESEHNEPFVFQVGERQVIRGWDVGITLINVGTKGTLYLPPNLAYGKTGVGKVIPPNSPLIFEVELLKIMTIEEYDQYMKRREEKERRTYEAKAQQQFQKDLQIIKTYAKKNKLKVTNLPSGLSYVLKKKGKGDKAKAGDKLTVHYEGQLTDNDIFSTTFGSKPFEFVLGKGKVIPGWDEGLQHFKKGSVGWLLIPSKMAYGPRSIVEEDINIPSNSVLIFKIKVLSIN